MPNLQINKYIYTLFKVILHQFWVKKVFPWKINLEYGVTFTKLFMLVSSRNMFQTTIEICNFVCMLIVLAIALWRLINFRLFCSDDCRSWPREEKINNHGCWSKHAHIPDNDYWGICLFRVVWNIFVFCHYSYVVHTEYIFISIFIFHSGNLPERVQILGHLHYCPRRQNYLLSIILQFALKICFWTDF